MFRCINRFRVGTGNGLLRNGPGNEPKGDSEMKVDVDTSPGTLRNKAGITAAGGVGVDIRYDTPHNIDAETRAKVDAVIEQAKQLIESGIQKI